MSTFAIICILLKIRKGDWSFEITGAKNNRSQIH